MGHKTIEWKIGMVRKVISCRMLRVSGWLCLAIVLAGFALHLVRGGQYAVEWSYAHTYFSVETNDTGKVVQPDVEIWDYPDLPEQFAKEFLSHGKYAVEAVSRFREECAPNAEDEKEFKRIFGTISYAVERAPITVVTLRARSRNPGLAMKAARIAESMMASETKAEAEGRIDKALSSSRHRLQRRRDRGEDVSGELAELEDVERRMRMREVKYHRLAAPHFAGDPSLLEWMERTAKSFRPHEGVRNPPACPDR